MRILLAGVAAMLAAHPALAQSSPAPPLPDPNDQSDTFTLGVGAAYLPDYEGSNDYRFIPAAAVRGRVGGHSFSSRGTYLYFNLLKGGPDKISFDVGPILGARFNRTIKVHDSVVRTLGKLNTAIEVGGFVGVSVHGLTNPYDVLSFRLDAVKDVANAHKSTVVTPAVEFSTPLSRTFYVGLSASADFVGGRYADYYYSITPAQSLISGLPAYNASGGYKSWKLSALVNKSLTGDLTHGLSLFGTTSYSRLQKDFKNAPIVRLHGDAGQWLAAAGLAYTW